jgi:hypothetical protein
VVPRGPLVVPALMIGQAPLTEIPCPVRPSASKQALHAQTENGRHLQCRPFLSLSVLSAS